ncbi:MAG: hypothetical protein CfP315_0796 [Candidatus Improbicoccus pseudotrichonymphae]|uniref:Uncharacterized protein n=1 Tax=Candidatus Improbicoccus pseudotrichonymphae TaxID=3033792 RepID=A0AA48HYR6_9FIRM|nr:MAG: hypothetical protein CfP315_0796 [Candidatus Improbicoccus pseudotrichonymphae]
MAYKTIKHLRLILLEETENNANNSNIFRYILRHISLINGLLYRDIAFAGSLSYRIGELLPTLCEGRCSQFILNDIFRRIEIFLDEKVFQALCAFVEKLPASMKACFDCVNRR